MKKDKAHSSTDLKQMQSMPLETKIIMSEQRIRAWYEHYDGNVYISFSGGKDSTVLLHLVRNIYPEVEAVFSDTGLEYPEIREFVKTFENVTWVKPSMNFKQVIQTYGYPVISKEISRKIHYYKMGSEWVKKYVDGVATDSEGRLSRYNIAERWKKLKDAPFNVSDTCCDIIKKKPIREYENRTGKVPFIGTLAEESDVRLRTWERTGCNAFDVEHPHSNPMSFWTENDVLEYLLKYNIPYCPVYGDIVQTGGKIKRINGYVDEYRMSECDRTGCIFCLFGIHMERRPNRMERMKLTHSTLYKYCMKPIEHGGLGIADVLDYLNIPSAWTEEDKDAEQKEWVENHV